MSFLTMFPLHPMQAVQPIYPVNPVMLFTNVSRWISQRVRSLFPAPPGLGAFDLPAELTLIISSHLDVPSRLSLALTCQTLFFMCFPKRLSLDSAEKEELLLLLERDVSTHYLCHCCVKLHRWHGRWTRSITQWDLNRLSCARRPQDFLFFPTIYGLKYYYARLLMNRHLYGPRHGPPLRSLDRQNRSLRFPDGVIQAASHYGRIVDNQLLLLHRISVSHPKGDTASVRQHINYFQYMVCTHMTMGRGSPDYGPVGVPELAEPKSASSHFSSCSRGLGSCSICLTDYTIDITWRDDQRGYLITVLVYNQVGECRSPSAWEWRTMSRERVLRDELLRKDRLEYGLGCVRDRWHKSEGIVMEAKGDWVAISRYEAESRSENLTISHALWSMLY